MSFHQKLQNIIEDQLSLAAIHYLRTHYQEAIDIYKKLHPGVSERRLVLVGQSATVGLVGLGLLWIPLMQNISGTLYQYLQSVQGYISPPITAVFLLGLFWKRLNAQGALAALGVGFVLGMGRLVAELNKDSLSGFLYNFADINFMHVAIFLFLICAAVLVIVSLWFPPPSEQRVAGLTWSRAGNAQLLADSDPSKRRMDRALSIVLVLIVAAVMVYFS